MEILYTRYNTNRTDPLTLVSISQNPPLDTSNPNPSPIHRPPS